MGADMAMDSGVDPDLLPAAAAVVVRVPVPVVVPVVVLEVLEVCSRPPWHLGKGEGRETCSESRKSSREMAGTSTTGVNWGGVEWVDWGHGILALPGLAD